VLATVEVLRHRKIHAPYTLVSAEVNGGAGSGPEASFAATTFEVLEGSREYPLRVSEVVARLERDYRPRVEPLPQPTRVKMERAKKEAMTELGKTGTRGRVERSESTCTYVTWMPETKRLQVEFRTRVAVGEFFKGKGIEAKRPGPDPSRPATSDAGFRYGIEYGVELGVVYEVGKEGVTVSSRLIEPQPFVLRIGPPGGASSGIAPPPPSATPGNPLEDPEPCRTPPTS